MHFKIILPLLLLSIAGSYAYADPCISQPSGAPVSKGDATYNLIENLMKTLRFDGGIGESHFKAQQNGVWWQDGMDHQLNMNSATVSIGVVSDIDQRTKLRVGYQYLGKASSSALATASDENYAECKNNHSKCWPLSHWYGSGTVNQVYVGIDRDFKVGGVDLVGEVNLDFYRPTWTMTIPDWRPEEHASPQFLQVTHDTTLQVAPSFGIGVRLPDKYTLIFNLEYGVHAGGDQIPAIYNGPAETLMLRKEY